jgi:hypothetical protein
MFSTNQESSFFLDHINKTHKVLEYGSGESTFEIAQRCKEILSIEHQENWFFKIKNDLPSNAKIVLRTPNLPYTEGGDCGTYQEFKDYIDYPIPYGPYDIILIDGRARVSCASICSKLGNQNTIVFIHDFNREEYRPALNFLNLINQVGTMAKFSIL